MTFTRHRLIRVHRPMLPDGIPDKGADPIKAHSVRSSYRGGRGQGFGVAVASDLCSSEAAAGSTATYLLSHAHGKANTNAALVHGFSTSYGWAVGFFVLSALISLLAVNAPRPSHHRILRGPRDGDLTTEPVFKPGPWASPGSHPMRLRFRLRPRPRAHPPSRWQAAEIARMEAALYRDRLFGPDDLASFLVARSPAFGELGDQQQAPATLVGGARVPQEGGGAAGVRHLAGEGPIADEA